MARPARGSKTSKWKPPNINDVAGELSPKCLIRYESSDCAHDEDTLPLAVDAVITDDVQGSFDAVRISQVGT